jgi:hypothetical protein
MKVRSANFAVARVLTGFFLIAFTLAITVPVSSSKHRISDKPPAPAPHSAQWRVGEPVQFENLIVYPVLSTISISPSRYITLDEGLKKGTVIVSELGTNGRVRRLRAGQEVSDDAEVNKLLVTNRSGKTLLLIAGEIVAGGTQDRIVGHDCLIAATGRPVPVDVFCVEQGRWSEDGAFGQSRADTITANNRRSTRARGRGIGPGRRGGIGHGQSGGVGHGQGGGTGQGQGGGIGHGQGGGVGGGTGAGSGPASAGALASVAPTFLAVEGAMASPNIREKAQNQNSQSAVWSEVAKEARANHVTSATDNLTQVFKDSKVRSNLAAFDGLKTKLPADCIGAVASINGEFVSADVFATPVLFRAYWPKLLRSLALQATSSTKRTSDVPTLSDARAFLIESGTRQSGGERKPLYRLVERKSETAASFELHTSTPTARSLIHFNKVAKN